MKQHKHRHDYLRLVPPTPVCLTYLNAEETLSGLEVKDGIDEYEGYVAVRQRRGMLTPRTWYTQEEADALFEALLKKKFFTHVGRTMEQIGEIFVKWEKKVRRQ